MSDLQKLHSMVWDLRKEIHATWPTPPPEDCLRYSLTEAGEAMDAWLRLTRPGDARNHAKSADVLAELADLVMMLLSALGPEWGEDWRVGSPPPGDTNLDEICAYTTANLLALTQYQYYDISGVLDIVLVIDSYPGMNLEMELAALLARIRAKHIIEYGGCTSWTTEVIEATPPTRPGTSSE